MSFFAVKKVAEILDPVLELNAISLNLLNYEADNQVK